MVPVLCLGLLACNQGPSNGIIQMRILGTDGANPVDGVDEGTLTIAVRHDGQLVDCDGGPCTSEIRDGDFKLDLPLTSFSAITAVNVEIEGDGERWIGAMPPFLPWGEGVDLTGVARIAVGHPMRCEPLTLEGPVTGDPPHLEKPRRRVAAVVRRNVVLLAGGLDADDADDDHVDRFDELLIDTDPLPTWEAPKEIGAAHGLSLTEDTSLVVGDASSWVFQRAESTPPRAVAITLAGASFESALVDLGASGGAVVGGTESDAIHWLYDDGVSAGTTHLVTPRAAPAAVALGGGVLVVGGNVPGTPAAEWAQNNQNGEPLDASDLPAARGGFLLPSPDRTAAIWIGFETAEGPSTQTWVFRDCRDCVAEQGPITWDGARAEVTAVVTRAGALWLIGGEDADGNPSGLVDIVRWAGSTPTIERGPDLQYLRAGAIAFEHASGIVTIAGGRGEGGLRNDVEMCFPAGLDPL